MINKIESGDAVCQWKNSECENCTCADPFTTDRYCHVIVKLFLSDNNIKCPECSESYLKINEEHCFECSSCGYSEYFTSFI